ncbi:MAG: CapA family protein [Bacteroidales bacterium]
MKQCLTHMLFLILFLCHTPLLAQLSVSTTPAIQNNTKVNISSRIYFPKELINKHDTINIVFIGDVMQHTPQLSGALIKGKEKQKPESYNYSHMFKYIQPILQKANIAVANMEFPMGGAPYKGYPLFSAPESIVWQAKKSGINLFLLANNHILDMEKEGLNRTLNIYKELGVNHTGAYFSKEEEEKKNPIIFNINGTKIAIINFTYGTNGNTIPKPYVINLMDSIHVKQTINKAKQHGAQIIIAAPHWGEEYQLYPSATQRKWAKMLFREGVKIIIGTHPHVPQVAEIYYDAGEVQKFIFYSLGNYITNQSIPNYSQIELLVKVSIVKNNFTNKIIILPPNYEFMWCFKKNEFETDYTVIPIKELINKEHLVKNKFQYKRMINTYNYILEKKLIKEIYGR